jgi:carbon-monoxide dehydrogenase small subunit
MNKVFIKVNGTIFEREISSDLRLIDFIRDVLKLKGTKEGCGEGECGACTVIMDGYTVNSCLVFTASANGSEIITIEGVGKEQLEPIQQAFIEVGAVQCGYCIPGMVLSAKCLLDKNPNVEESEVRKGISGNLCRCTGYEKIVQGVMLAKKIMEERK